ncbi:hypothetical protein QQ045_026031 [Rhodiola kirilowii]
MLTDRSRPMIDRVSKFLIPTSKSKLDRSTMIRYDMGGGIGLGILAALERSNHVAGSANPIPVHNYGRLTGFEEMTASFKDSTKYNNNGEKKKISIFSLSPRRFKDDFEAFPTSEFLSSCNLCRKKLSGKDIYMYRGEKAFCSEECREVQIRKDEKKEKLRSHGVSRSAASSSPYVRDQRMLLATGIFAI